MVFGLCVTILECLFGVECMWSDIVSERNECVNSNGLIAVF